MEKTEFEEVRYRDGLPVCPDCGDNKWYEGPHGGLSVNIKCANHECGRKFNWMGPFGMDRIDLPPHVSQDWAYRTNISKGDW